MPASRLERDSEFDLRATMSFARLAHSRGQAHVRRHLPLVGEPLRPKQFRPVLHRGEDAHARMLPEEIREIEKDVKGHLAMLYGPVTRKGERRRRLHEEALQAYFHCRLRDRLPDCVLDKRTQVFLDREPLANINQRLDIKVQAPTIEGKRATVVIEVKWSDNTDVSSALSDQLGNDYLVGQSPSHGIYLVGWCKRVSDGKPGTWKRNAPGAKPGRPYSIVTWTKALRDQARLYSESRPEIRIEPVIIDLSWS